MAIGGEYKDKFYAGADYGLNPNYGSEFSTGLFPKYRISAGNFGFPTDLRTANQLKAVSDKLNTGAKTIEVSGVQAATWETVPQHHIEEIYRLKKLTGADLTFHGPLVDPTGITKQGWEEAHRKSAESQMWQSVERAQAMDKDGNLVVTFHSSMIPNFADTKVKGKSGEVISDVGIVDIHNGNFGVLPVDTNFFKGESDKPSSIEEQQKRIAEYVKDRNKDAWFQRLFNVSYHAGAGMNDIQRALGELQSNEKETVNPKEVLEMYDSFLKGNDSAIQKIDGPEKAVYNQIMTTLVHGDTYLRDAYQNLQKLFNEAYDVASKNKDKSSLDRLEAFRNEIKGSVKDLENPTKLVEFGTTITKGVNLLRGIEAPKSNMLYRDFAIDKSSDTFSNVAFNSFAKFGKNSPIISIENPPAGTAALDRAQDLRDLVEESRKKLIGRLVHEQNMSENEAKKQAEKLIGVTWDVGHINMMKKYGYNEKDIAKEAEKVGALINKIHLSDNFGMEHTELPMGMGNIDLKEQFGALKRAGANVEQLKQIVETGNWFGPQAFGNSTPFAQTLKSFGSPLYSMSMGPYWNQAFSSSGGYFSGYGQVLPDQHFSTYGAGFSGMPKELGGQQAGGRSRVGGTPVD